MVIARLDINVISASNIWGTLDISQKSNTDVAELQHSWAIAQ